MQSVKYPDGYNEESILRQINEEHDESIEFAEKKRKLFARNRKLYRNLSETGDDRTKSKSRKLRLIIKQLVALHDSGDKKVSFVGRQLSFSNATIAKKMDNLAEYDYDQLELAVKFSAVIRDSFVFGSGVLIQDGRDDLAQAPKYKIIRPESVILDRYANINDGHRYMHIIQEVSKEELTIANGFFNIGSMKTNSEMEAKRIADGLVAGGHSQEYAHSTQKYKDALNKRDNMCTIQQAYTRFNGKAYIVSVANDRSKLIKLEEVKPVRKEEKKDNKRTPLPFVVFQWSPIDGDPYGESIPDLAADKQDIEQRFVNMQIRKARDNSYGADLLVDSEIYTEVQEAYAGLKRGKRIIPIDSEYQKEGSIRELPQDRITSDDTHIVNMVNDELNGNIGLDQRSQGISQGTGLTATENQRVQKNANMRMKQDAMYLMVSWKRFWDILRYRAYQENFDPKSEKNIYLNSQYGSPAITIKKVDFDLLADVDIQIMDKGKVEEIDQEDKQMKIAVLQTMQPDDEHGQKTLKRKLLTLNGISEEEANIFVKPGFHEMMAQNFVTLLNQMSEVGEKDEKKVEPLPEFDMDEPHETYIAIYHTAFESKRKYREITRRQLALMEREMREMKQQTQQPNNMAQAQAAQLTNNAIQQSNRQENRALSLEDSTNG